MTVEARVDLSAIRDNVRWLRTRTRADVMGMVKADGYGHGLVASGWAALAGGATWLGTAFLTEALSLRDAGIAAPVLSCMVSADDDLVTAVRAGVDLSLSGRGVLAATVTAARSVRLPARIHLEVDTGMGRGGVVPGADWEHMLAEVAHAAAEGLVRVVGIWTHLACADEPDHPANARQLANYAEALRVADRLGVRPEVRHAANSPATLRLPDAHFDVVRLGAAIYGLSPFPEAVLELTPAMVLAARVSALATGDGPPTDRPNGADPSHGADQSNGATRPNGVDQAHGAGQPNGAEPSHGTGQPHGAEPSDSAGRPDGMGGTGAAGRWRAVSPLGYGDGVPSEAGDVVDAWLGGARCRIVQPVLMNQSSVAVADHAVAVGDRITYFGSGDGQPTANEWATALHTDPREITSRVGARVPRVYLHPELIGPPS
ncbi:MAG: alanine racemase [Actinocatenispora sp.]